jgi:glycerol-3-phosphate dehydrogenase (NAD(P)+)
MLRLWVYERDLAERMHTRRENDLYLPGLQLPDSVEVTSDLCRATAGAEVVLTVTPSHVARQVYTQMLPCVSESAVFVSATKGLEGGTLLRMSDVAREVIGQRFAPRVATLSGPTFAREVARGDPTAVVVASPDQELNAAIQAAFSGPSFRVYTNTDQLGVELAASLKNIVAIGAGVCQGLGLGNNTIAALITRGLAEITRLAVAMGGRPATLAGLAGLGDLVLTCTGELSRNRRTGIELARGLRIEEITAATRMVAEGVQTTYAAMDLSRKWGIDLPITRQVSAILRAEKPPREAVRELMERALKGE